MEERALARGQGTIPEGLPESDGKLRAKTEGSRGDGTRKAKGRYGRKAGSVGKKGLGQGEGHMGGLAGPEHLQRGDRNAPGAGAHSKLIHSFKCPALSFLM